MTTGKVYLIGAGPGAPDLLTLRAAALLERADVLFYDALVHPGTIALAARAQRIAVGKRCGRHSTAQRFINKRLIDAARMHAVVVRLKGGDPMLFGRAHEEITALREAQIEFEVVPGVTAALAASAELGVSLTRRGVARSVVFLTPRVGAGEAPNEWAQAALAADTAVVYMGAGQAAAIAGALLARGMSPSTPIAVVENASWTQQKSYTLTLSELPGIEELGLSGPALIMIGEIYKALAAQALPASLKALSA